MTLSRLAALWRTVLLVKLFYQMTLSRLATLWRMVVMHDISGFLLRFLGWRYLESSRVTFSYLTYTIDAVVMT